MKLANTMTMMVAADRMTRPLCRSPAAIAVAGFVAVFPFLLDPADQEYLVVGGQADQDGEQDQRQEGLDQAGGVVTEDAVGVTGTPQRALDTASTIHLAGLGHKPGP